MAKEIKRKMANYIDICCFLPYLMYMTGRVMGRVEQGSFTLALLDPMIHHSGLMNCLHVYIWFLQSGSSCQSPEGKPNARRSTSGYSAKSDCILESMSLPGDMMSRKYLMMHILKYIRSWSVGKVIQGRRN